MATFTGDSLPGLFCTHHTSAAMSTIPRRTALATPSPTKRLTPVVEIPVARTRSSVKRTSSAHTTSGGASPDAKRQRTGEEPTAGPSNLLRDGGSPIQQRERAFHSSEMLSKTMQQVDDIRTSQAVASTSKLPPPIPSSSKKPFTLPGQEKATRRKLGKVNDLLSGTTSKAVDFGFDDQDSAGDNEGLENERRIARDTTSSFYSTSSLPIMESGQARRVEHASSTSASVAESMQVDEESPPGRKQTQASHKLPSPAPSTIASTSQLPSQPNVIAHTPTKQRRVAQLVTPTSSSKKRTPTKAVKTKAQGQDDFLSAPAPSFNIFPTPSTTPDRSPRQNTSYPTKEIISVLQKVLEQLSSPCSSISVTKNVDPADTGYKTWLASQPCLSQAHAAAEKDVRNTLDRTIRDGEGNCMLIIGERGIGKSAIIERSLKMLEGVYGKNAFLTVKLSGLVQRDDKSAVREIARQLCSSSYSEEVEEGSQFVSLLF